MKVGGAMIVLLAATWAGTALAAGEAGTQAAPGRAGGEQLNGLTVMKSSRELYTAGDMRSKVTLTLIDKDEKVRKIVTRRFWKHYGGKDGFDSKILFLTEQPPDQRGVGFLIWDYAGEGKNDDLWLYLPSLRKTRRMSVRDQDDSFMGSDLTFADMGQRRLDEDEHQLLREEKLNGVDTYVVQSVPKDKSSVYSRRLSWIARDGTTRKIEYYDRKNELLKIQTIEWQNNQNVLVWLRAKVQNVQTGHRTIFEITDLKVNTGLSDQDFTERTLQAGLR